MDMAMFTLETMVKKSFSTPIIDNFKIWNSQKMVHIETNNGKTKKLKHRLKVYAGICFAQDFKDK